jgi:hypothetical protein
MADELEPVEQQFIANLSDYIEPIEEAAGDTQGLADAVGELDGALDSLDGTAEAAGESLGSLRDKTAEAAEVLTELDGAADATDASLDGMAASADDDAVSVEALAEAYGRFRDEVYETNPGIDDATASLLAQAAAADAAGLELDGFGADLERTNYESGGLYDSLAQIKNLLGGAELGESIAVTRTGMNSFLIDTEEEATEAAAALGGMRTGSDLLDDSMIKARNSTADFWEAVNALNPSMADSENIAKDAKVALLGMGASEVEAAAGAQALARAQRDMDMAGGEGGGFLSAIVSFFAGGGEGGGVSVGALLGNIGALSAGLLVLAPAIAAVITEVGAFVGGLVAAGAGVGAFAALAIPSLSKIATSYEGISTAQSAYREAVQLEARDPTKDNLEAEATAAAKLKIAWADVPSYVRPALKSIDDLKTEYMGMVKAFEPDAFKVFDDGLKIASDLLPSLKPLAGAAAGAIGGLLTQLDKAIQLVPGGVNRLGHLFGGVSPGAGSGGFQQFVEFLSKISPAVITAVGEGLGRVGTAFAKDMESFSKKDYINAINIAFYLLAGTLNRVTYLAHNVMNMWDDLSAGAKSVRNWFDTARHAVAEFGSAVQSILKEAGTDESNWVNDVRRDTDDAVRLWDQLVHDVESDWNQINSDVSHAGAEVRSTVVSVGHEIEAVWDAAWARVVSYTRSLPGRILGALGDIGSLLTGAGQHLVEGLINGVRSEVGNLIGSVESMASSALSAAEHALGLGSPSRITHQHGIWLMQGYANGITDGRGLVESALRWALGGVPAAFPGGSATAAPVHITVPITLTGGASLASPQQLQQLQQVVQEAILRYTQLNQGSGLFLPGRRS